MVLTRAEISRRYRLRHPDRVRAQRAASATRQREYERRYRLAKRYGLTPEQVDEMLLAQGGRCAVCQTDNPGARTWHVDHCHGSGRIRGLLCGNCNRGLGLFADDPSVLRAAINYLEVRHA